MNPYLESNFTREKKETCFKYLAATGQTWHQSTDCTAQMHQFYLYNLKEKQQQKQPTLHLQQGAM